MGKPLDYRRRAALKQRVRAEVTRLLGLGLEPSERKLRVAFPRHGAALLLALRDELADAGLVDWREPYGEGEESGRVPGLSGATADERAEVKARAAAIRAENTAAGRVSLSPPSCPRPGRVFKDPRMSWR